MHCMHSHDTYLKMLIGEGIGEGTTRFARLPEEPTWATRSARLPEGPISQNGLGIANLTFMTNIQIQHQMFIRPHFHSA